MTKKFANRLSKLQRKLQIEERDVKNPNEMKKLAMGDRRWDKHIDALQDLWRAEFNKEQKQKKENSNRMYSASNKKGGKVKYSKGGGVRTAKYKV